MFKEKRKDFVTLLFGGVVDLRDVTLTATENVAPRNRRVHYNWMRHLKAAERRVALAAMGGCESGRSSFDELVEAVERQHLIEPFSLRPLAIKAVS